MLARLATLTVVLALASCKERAEPPRPITAAPPSDAGDPVALARARVGELKARLKQALTAAVTERGPAGAIDVCAEVAPALAAAGTSGSIRIGRATPRPRNPQNLAAGWQAEAIAHFAAMAPADRASAVYTTRLPDGATAYAEPLIVADLCLACHGQALAPDVTATLATRYPGDRATGYAVGDLRGVAWAEVR